MASTEFESDLLCQQMSLVLHLLQERYPVYYELFAEDRQVKQAALDEVNACQGFDMSTADVDTPLFLHPASPSASSSLTDASSMATLPGLRSISAALFTNSSHPDGLVDAFASLAWPVRRLFRSIIQQHCRDEQNKHHLDVSKVCEHTNI